MKNDFETWYDNGFITENTYNKLCKKENIIIYKNSSIDDLKNGLKISIIISTYNRFELLHRLIISILNQDYGNIEIIIVDDASSDGSSSKIKKLVESVSGEKVEVKYFRNEINKGVGESKKQGYINATGDIIIFSDDDDYYIDDHYFSVLNDLYQRHLDVCMIVAPTIIYYKKQDEYIPQMLNLPESLTTCEYMNGFMTKFDKPNSMFTMSMRAKSIDLINYEELKYFNDTPIYLFGLLADGNVKLISNAVGIYFVHDKNYTGHAKTDYIIGNLEAKKDIYKRALKENHLNEPKRWFYKQVMITGKYYLVGNKKKSEDDKNVWKWLKENFSTADYFKAKISISIFRLLKKERIKNMLSNYRYICI